MLGPIVSRVTRARAMCDARELICVTMRFSHACARVRAGCSPPHARVDGVVMMDDGDGRDGRGGLEVWGENE